MDRTTDAGTLMHMDQATQPSIRTEFQDRLIARTVEEAARHVPFYRRFWAGRDPAAVRRLADLPRLPVVTRDDLAAADFLREGVVAAVMIHSSGSTGEPFVRFRSQAELDATAAVARRIARASAKRVEQPRILFTTVEATLHGGGVPTPLPVHPVHISVRSRWLIDSAVALLLRDPIMPGLGDADVELNGRPRHLAILAHELIGLGAAAEGARSRVAHVSISGYGLTRAMRGFLSRAFPDAAFTETYSLSEIVGGAARCNSCGHYHFSAHVVGEVVPLAGGRTLTDRVGRLIVTELYPFSQLQPFVRYDTGDLVRRTDSDCDNGLSFDFVGRRSATPVVDRAGEPRPLLSVWELTEILETMPGVARGPLGTRLAAPYDRLPAGSPHAEAALDPALPGRLVLRVGTDFPTALFPERTDALRAAILARCERADPLFAATLQSGLPVTVELKDGDDLPPTLNLGK